MVLVERRGFLGEDDGADSSGIVMGVKKVLLAWVMRRPELDKVGRLISSDASVSSASSSSETFLRLRLMVRREVADKSPALLPRGRPPRLTDRALDAPARLPRGRPPRFTVLPLVGVIVAKVGMESPDAGSIFIFGRRAPPLPLRPPVLPPPRGGLEIGIDTISLLVRKCSNTLCRAASHSAAFG